MISLFKQVDIDNALPGMRLSDAILDAHGGVLLPSGTSLTDATLQSLRQRGITQILVLNDDVSNAELEVERVRVRQRLDKLFSQRTNNEKNRLLLQYMIQYRFGDTP